MYSEKNSDIICKGNSSVIFSNSDAKQVGGGALSIRGSNVNEGNSVTVFNNNEGTLGGALTCYMNCTITFKANYTIPTENTTCSYNYAHGNSQGH